MQATARRVRLGVVAAVVPLVCSVKEREAQVILHCNRRLKEILEATAAEQGQTLAQAEAAARLLLAQTGLQQRAATAALVRPQALAAVQSLTQAAVELVWKTARLAQAALVVVAMEQPTIPPQLLDRPIPAVAVAVGALHQQAATAAVAVLVLLLFDTPNLRLLPLQPGHLP